MEIVTGVGEKPHVTSKKFRRIIESITGQGSYIIGCGDNMSTELVSNNLLKIKSGAMIHHGNVSSVDPYDEIEINNGTQGMKRIDLVVNRYTKNAETEIEKNEWIVIQGAPAASNPAVPEHVVGNLQEGDLVDDCPFCQIYIDGINVTEVKELLTIIPNVPDLVAENAARKQEVAELNSNISKLGVKTTRLSVTTDAYGNASVLSKSTGILLEFEPDDSTIYAVGMKGSSGNYRYVRLATNSSNYAPLANTKIVGTVYYLEY